MDFDLNQGRGRGRGVDGSNIQNRGELRRPLAHSQVFPPEIANGQLTHEQHENQLLRNIQNPYIQQQSYSNTGFINNQSESRMNHYNQSASYQSSVPVQDQITKELSSMAVSNTNMALPRIVSTLSAEAPEFVPRFETGSQVPSQFYNAPQQPLIQTNVSSNLVMNNQVFQQPSAPQLQYLSHPVILQINNLVVKMTTKPHKFDQIATQMTSMLSWQVKEANLMKEIISVIFEQGVGEPNFRFNGGRLCQHLVKHITQSYNGPTFKALLLEKCQEEYEYRDFYLQNEPTRLCGFTLFLADIYNHVLTPNGQPLDILRLGICKLLLTLMSNATSSNLKCVAQVLKGSGHALDSGGGQKDMEVVMCTLKDVSMTAKIPVNVRSMLLAVVELRAANWGRTSGADSAPAPTSAPAPPDVPHMGTVYYGPGGVIQRVEDENDDSASDTDDGLAPQGEELEGEEAQAFEEFLRSQQQ